MSTQKSIKNSFPADSKVAIIGAGNIGNQFACICASKGYSVNVFSSKPWMIDETLEVVDEFGNTTIGRIAKATSSIHEAVTGCKIVFVTYPAFMLSEVADLLLPYVSSDMFICVLPGTGGAEYAFRKCINSGATLFGLQRVPSVARLEEYGKRVRCEGLRKELFLASIPNEMAVELSTFMSSLCGIPCFPLPNYLCVTLTPSNPILHTTRLRTIFDDYYEGLVYEKNPLFYGDWDDASSKLLLACDEELQDMLQHMNNLDLSCVRSLKLHYESNTVKSLTKKLRSIKSLQGLKTPMKQVDGGWIPDFKSRYFMADFPYGLAIIEEFAKVLLCDVPNISDTMNWYRNVTGDNNHFNLGEYGVYSPEDVFAFYLR